MMDSRGEFNNNTPLYNNPPSVFNNNLHQQPLYYTNTCNLPFNNNNYPQPLYAINNPAIYNNTPFNNCNNPYGYSNTCSNNSNAISITNCSDYLNNVLDRIITSEMHNASIYATRFTINMRVLEYIMNYLEIKKEIIYEMKSLLKIDISCSRAIEKYWLQLKQQQLTALTSDENNIFERFLTKDYVRNSDLYKLSNIIVKKFPILEFVSWLFAIDGLHFYYKNSNSTSSNTDSTSTSSKIQDYSLTADDLKHYFIHLKYAIEDDDVTAGGVITEVSEEENGQQKEKNDENHPHHKQQCVKVHVQTIRKIYKSKPKLTPQRLGMILRPIFYTQEDISSSSSSTDNKLIEKKDDDQAILELYLNGVGRYLNDIKHYKKLNFLKRKSEEKKKSGIKKNHKRSNNNINSSSSGGSRKKRKMMEEQEKQEKSHSEEKRGKNQLDSTIDSIIDEIITE